MTSPWRVEEMDGKIVVISSEGRILDEGGDDDWGPGRTYADSFVAMLNEAPSGEEFNATIERYCQGMLAR